VHSQHRAHGQVADKFGRRGCHIEDQVQAKRWATPGGHRAQDEMVDRVKAVGSTQDRSRVRGDSTHRRARGRRPEAAIDRACACVEAGADMIFPKP